MSRVAFLVGPETSQLNDFHEDPSSALRLAALAASWITAQKQTLLMLGDAPSLLALGTAVLGQQQSRVVEGGERRPSPIRVLSLLESENSDLDRSLSFQRRSREAPFDEEEGPQEIFGDLSLLMDVGVMDLVGESQRSLEPRPAEVIAETLSDVLFKEKPRGILAFGQVPPVIVRSTRRYTEELQVPFASVLGTPEGAKRLSREADAPILNGRKLRLRTEQTREGEEGEGVYETADEELIQVARYGTWEAGMLLSLYDWLHTLEI